MFAFDRRRGLLATGLTAIGAEGRPLTALHRSLAERTDGYTPVAKSDDDESATADRSRDDGRAVTTDDAIDTATDVDDRPTADSESGDGPATVEFLDCETVRITESAHEVILSLFWWDEEGLIGTIAEPVGGVSGERTISATEEFGPFAYGPVVTEVELFDAGTPIVPGGGDVVASNPDARSCAASIREEYDGPDELEPVEFA